MLKSLGILLQNVDDVHTIQKINLFCNNNPFVNLQVFSNDGSKCSHHLRVVSSLNTVINLVGWHKPIICFNTNDLLTCLESGSDKIFSVITEKDFDCIDAKTLYNIYKDPRVTVICTSQESFERIKFEFNIDKILKIDDNDILTEVMKLIGDENGKK